MSAQRLSKATIGTVRRSPWSIFVPQNTPLIREPL